MTSHNDPELRERVREELPDGVAEILAKPFTNERWLVVWARTLHMPEGPSREHALDCIADWVAAGPVGDALTAGEQPENVRQIKAVAS